MKPETYTAVEEGEYGYCVVMRGSSKGETVFYDDDSTAKTAIVFPGAFADGLRRIPRSWLRPATELETRRHLKAGKAISSRYV